MLQLSEAAVTVSRIFQLIPKISNIKRSSVVRYIINTTKRSDHSKIWTLYLPTGNAHTNKYIIFLLWGVLSTIKKLPMI